MTMESEAGYLSELLAEKDSLDPSFVHCMRLLTREINRMQGGGSPPVVSPRSKEDENINGTPSNEGSEGNLQDAVIPRLHPEPRELREPREPREPRHYRRAHPPEENKLYQPVKLSEKVFIPTKEHPKFNFVGKLLGPRGNTFKRLQNSTGTKMSILGKGSMRDKEKEEELKATGDAKYNHLSEDLHVLIEVEAPPGQAHARLGIAIEEIKKFLIPETNDEIHQEQMREMAILNSMDDPPPTSQAGTQPAPAPTAGRGRARPRVAQAPITHQVPARGIITRQGHPLALRRVQQGPMSVTVRSAAGLPSSPTMAHPAPRGQAQPGVDPYGGMHALLVQNEPPQAEHVQSLRVHETYDPAYGYEAAYTEPEEVTYYDYGRGVAPAEIYETAYPAFKRRKAT
ncbi:KH domain-containing, RNA-binding, signal transduction-associated protein 2-like isoform X2 [Actinia tenebrosa]|uniref:KH domain-containing, RNA-binding, signal transduction-associated protein 2-like isoform X2 n=1 Tax=Actinia tenebrosa TaxID=6105 RepID=A0A6P8HT73_ACTTE|nr:KH domain-containing, RNA-binding, signal transduction-associated protein 2-like isoform X2 [Actinia tenebrosa]